MKGILSWICKILFLHYFFYYVRVEIIILQKEVIIINDLIEKEDIKIENMIYVIRGKQVMLDSEISATKWHGIIYLI